MIIYLGCARLLELIRWNQNRDDNSEHQPVRLQLRISSAHYRKTFAKKNPRGTPLFWQENTTKKISPNSAWNTVKKK